MLPLRRISSVVFVNMKKFTYAFFTMIIHDCAEAGTKAQSTHRHWQRENVEKKKNCNRNKRQNEFEIFQSCSEIRSIQLDKKKGRSGINSTFCNQSRINFDWKSCTTGAEKLAWKWAIKADDKFSDENGEMCFVGKYRIVSSANVGRREMKKCRTSGNLPDGEREKWEN